MSMLHVVQAISSTDLSFGAVLDCTDLSLDGLVSLSRAAVGVADSDWAFFVHDFGWDVCADCV